MKVPLYVDTGVAPCAATVVPTPEGDPDEDASGRHKNLVLTYLPENAGRKPLQNLWGTDAAASENVAVTNASADRCASLRPSGMSGPSGQGKSVTLDFGRTLNTAKKLAAGNFEVAATGASGTSPPAVAGASYTADATGVALALNRALTAGDGALHAAEVERGVVGRRRQPD